MLAVASQQDVARILQGLVHAARKLVDARYAALGIPDDQGRFEEFLTSGMTDAEIAAIGPLPRTHGMLDAVMQSTTSLRLPNLQSDRRFAGWPANHPDMRSLLGVPIIAKGTVIGAFYLTDKKSAPAFTDADQALIERFAAHAAVVIENARLFERSRELSVMEERNRLARELHDSVTQTLFSLSLTAEAAAELLSRDTERASSEIRKVVALAHDALTEMRNLVFELRPPALEVQGLVETLRKHVDVIRRASGVDVSLDVDGVRHIDPVVESQLFRIIQEALNNAVKHSRAEAITVSLSQEGETLRAAIRDDGSGFDPKALPARSKHLGLTSMEERARSVGGRVSITSAPGEGTTVSVEVDNP